MLLFLFRVLSHLPLCVLQALGGVLGRLVYAMPGKYRRRLRAHMVQAGYPQAAMARRAAGHAGAAMLELAWIWGRGDTAVQRVVAHDEHVADAARAEGKSLLYLTPHLGCFEISARYMAREHPMTVLYRPHRKAALAPLVESMRATPTMHTAPANLNGVRQLVRALRRGEAVGILPDQVPGQGEGIWAPFFGRPAFTMTLPGRLAMMDNVAVIAAACERLPRGQGWRLHLERLEGPPPTDPAAQAAWINAAMERLIRRFPEQYLWSYNRYKQPAGASGGPGSSAAPSSQHDVPASATPPSSPSP